MTPSSYINEQCRQPVVKYQPTSTRNQTMALLHRVHNHTCNYFYVVGALARCFTEVMLVLLHKHASPKALPLCHWHTPCTHCYCTRLCDSGVHKKYTGPLKLNFRLPVWPEEDIPDQSSRQTVRGNGRLCIEESPGYEVSLLGLS